VSADIEAIRARWVGAGMMDALQLPELALKDISTLLAALDAAEAERDTALEIMKMGTANQEKMLFEGMGYANRIRQLLTERDTLRDAMKD